MDSIQIFKDPEKRKLPKKLDSGFPEETLEEQEERIEALLDEFAALIKEAKDSLNKKY